MVQACSHGAGVEETSKTVDVVYIRTGPLSAIDTAFLSSLSRTNELPRKKAFPNNISLSRVGSHSAVGKLQFHGFGPSPHLSDSTPSLDRVSDVVIKRSARKAPGSHQLKLAAESDQRYPAPSIDRKQKGLVPVCNRSVAFTSKFAALHCLLSTQNHLSRSLRTLP